MVGLAGLLFYPAEHIFQADAEYAGNTKGAFQGWGIAPLFNGDHRLTGHTDFLGERRLAHIVMRFSEFFHPICDGGTFGHLMRPAGKTEW